MSTELKATHAFALTQYAGPVTSSAPADRRRLQVTQKASGFGPNDKTAGFVNMSKDDAMDLARALLDWVNDDRLPE